LRGTGEQGLILTRSRQEAKRWCTGSAQNVPKANHTFLWHVHRIDLAATVVAPVVPAERLAYATRCSRCTLRWLQSTTLPRMVLGLSRFCRGLRKRFFGRMQAGTHGNKVLHTVLSQEKQEASGRQSGLGSSSKPDLTFFDCAFVAMYLSCVCVLPLPLSCWN